MVSCMEESCLEHVSDYKSGDQDDPRIQAPLIFYKLFLQGYFKQYTPNLIIFGTSTASVRSFEDTEEGESAVRDFMMDDDARLFACPARGFWTSGYNSEYSTQKPPFRGTAKVRNAVMFDEECVFTIF